MPHQYLYDTNMFLCVSSGPGGRVCQEAAGTGGVFQDEWRVRVP